MVDRRTTLASAVSNCVQRKSQSRGSGYSVCPSQGGTTSTRRRPSQGNRGSPQKTSHIFLTFLVESAKGDFGSQTRTSCQRRSTQISRSSSRHKSKLQYLAHARRNSCSRKSVSAFLISKPRGEKKWDWWIIFF